MQEEYIFEGCRYHINNEDLKIDELFLMDVHPSVSGFSLIITFTRKKLLVQILNTEAKQSNYSNTPSYLNTNCYVLEIKQHFLMYVYFNKLFINTSLT